MNMKASDIITRLQELIKKHGDLDVGSYGDHEPCEYIDYNSESWVINGTGGVPTRPAFEFNGYGDIGKDDTNE